MEPPKSDRSRDADLYRVKLTRPAGLSINDSPCAADIACCASGQGIPGSRGQGFGAFHRVGATAGDGAEADGKLVRLARHGRHRGFKYGSGIRRHHAGDEFENV